MPHVTVKMYPGRSAADKRAMAEQVADVLHASMGYAVENVSVAVEEVEPARWMEDVYGPDIAGRVGQLAKRPGYGPLADVPPKDAAPEDDRPTSGA